MSNSVLALAVLLAISVKAASVTAHKLLLHGSHSFTGAHAQLIVHARWQTRPV